MIDDLVSKMPGGARWIPFGIFLLRGLVGKEKGLGFRV